MQLDLFGEPPTAKPSLVGLIVTLPDDCPGCKGHNAVVGAGRGPHKASLRCDCGRHRGWMSEISFAFVSETVRQFGRPVDPLCVNRNSKE